MSILDSNDCWVHALRRDQGISRKGIRIVERSGFGSLKFHPIADWTRDQCWDAIRRLQIPYHPLHDDGYPSIGCRYCTKAIASGEDERDGRWTSFPAKTECGLHG